jgi:hypothetical protein
MSIGNQPYEFIDFQAIYDPICLIPDSHIELLCNAQLNDENKR